MAGFTAGALHHHTYTQVEAQMVRELRGDGNAAIVASRLAFRLEGRGDTHQAEGRLWWTASLRQIADETGLSLDQVKRSMKKLVDGGFVDQRQFMLRGASDRTMSYSLPIAEPGAEPPDARGESATSDVANPPHVQSHQDSQDIPPVGPPRGAANTTEGVLEGVLLTADGFPISPEPAPTKNPSAKGCRLDPEFVPSLKSRQTIATECPGLNIGREHAKFVDYWISQAGQKGVKVNWDATWRNWMRTASERSGRPNGSRGRGDWQNEVFARVLADGGEE